MDASEVYRGAAAGNMEFLKANKSEIGSFASRAAKNTILHIYIISRSKRDQKEKEKEKTKLQKLVISFKSWFKKPPASPPSASPPSPGDTVRAMLEEWPLLLRKANGNGDTPLHMAARHGQYGIVKVLIKPESQAGPSNEEDDVEKGGVGQRAVWEMLHEANADKETALHQAVRYGHTKVAKALIDADEPSFLYLPNKYDETPLYMAAERDDSDVVDLILEKYTSPAYQGPEGRTALHVVRAYTGIGIAIIKKKGLEFLTTKVDDRGRTPLHYLSGFVLQFDKSAAFVLDNDGNAPIHIAVVRKGFTWLVRWFLEECPECFELVDKQGRNALHLAILGGHKDTANLILHSELLCDLLKSKDNNGDTPLHLVAKSNNKDYHWPEAIEDPRFDKMARVSLAYDLHRRRHTLSNTEMRMYMCVKEASWEITPFGRLLRWSGVRFLSAMDWGFLLDMNSDTKNVKENSQGQINGPPEEDILKDERQSHLVVAALIATVTFAAGFTLPGGYIQDKGYAVLTKNRAFVAFVITNTFGLVFSCAAVFIHLLIAMDRYKESKTVRKLFDKALPITLLAIVAMVIAFITGTYAVLGHARSLAISASVIGGLFFYLLGYLVEEAQDSTSFPIFRWTLKAVELLLKILFFCSLMAIMALPYLLNLAFSHIVKLINQCCSRKEDKNDQRASELDHVVFGK